MKVEYTKVDESNAGVIALAKQTGEKPSTVAGMINQQAYRKAYNKLAQARMKVVRKLVKEHPELLEGGK